MFPHKKKENAECAKGKDKGMKSQYYNLFFPKKKGWGGGVWFWGRRFSRALTNTFITFLKFEVNKNLDLCMHEVTKAFSICLPGPLNL